MATYTITLSDAEIKAMEYVCVDVDSWIQTAFNHRIMTAMAALSDLEIAKAMRDQKPIITDREKLVELSNEPAMAEWVSAEEYNPDPDNPFVTPKVNINPEK